MKLRKYCLSALLLLSFILPICNTALAALPSGFRGHTWGSAPEASMVRTTHFVREKLDSDTKVYIIPDAHRITVNGVGVLVNYWYWRDQLYKVQLLGEIGDYKKMQNSITAYINSNRDEGVSYIDARFYWKDKDYEASKWQGRYTTWNFPYGEVTEIRMNHDEDSLEWTAVFTNIKLVEMRKKAQANKDF